MFNYNITATGSEIIGDKPTYLTYDFLLSTNLITNTVDLRRGFVESFAIFGGFMVTMYALLTLFVCSCQRFEGEKYLVQDLYTLNPMGGETLGPKECVK
jgi:hypothetical protein